MTSNQKLKRIANLLDVVKGQCEPFLKECSEARLLAMNNPALAVEKYFSLADTTLRNNSLSKIPSCSAVLKEVLSALANGPLDASYVSSLDQLRHVYFVNVLRPAVQTYLREGEGSLREMRKLYDRALKLDGLFHVAVFLKRISISFGLQPSPGST